MAKIKEMPGLKIISGLKGVLDYYYYMGIPCCRRWPRKPGGRRTPAVRSTWSAFAYATREWKNLSPVIRHSYEELAGASGLRSFDVFMRSYLKGLYRAPLP